MLGHDWSRRATWLLSSTAREQVSRFLNWVFRATYTPGPHFPRRVNFSRGPIYVHYPATTLTEGYNARHRLSTSLQAQNIIQRTAVPGLRCGGESYIIYETYQTYQPCQIDALFVRTQRPSCDAHRYNLGCSTPKSRLTTITYW